ncbi:phytoene dehydrogenase-like protein [Pedobacter sp. CAN_A7]|uniref:phytoene desaturase family protein n=1 Tax=Pedobacter sp. CAN_A7 TaxID=2787722 RepID=UPI0018CA6096
MEQKDYDAVVVGSGPNGLAAAITLQQQGLSVLLIEGKDQIGGGLRSAELTHPGFLHDICSAIHPMVNSSPFFKSLNLAAYGLEFVYPEINAAHPLDDGSAALLTGTVTQTAALLGRDEQAYLHLMQTLVKDWPKLAADVLSQQLKIPSHPVSLARFGIKGLSSALSTAKKFDTPAARALWAGMAAHSMLPLSNLMTSAIGMVLLACGHVGNWPIAKGGSQQIANALAAHFTALGGKIQTGCFITSIKQLPSAHAVLFDLTPRQLLALEDTAFSIAYRRKLENYRYGMGVFKIDWALTAAIPFTAQQARKAGTVHLGNTLEEIAAGEQAAASGRVTEKPFVLLAQQSLADPSRAPTGKHTAWAYCHVPHGHTQDMTSHIEQQVERFAPGFKDCILAKHTFNAAQMEAYNPNYIGGDINGGVLDIRQLFSRPVLSISPYRMDGKGMYLCSSSTPPGGGVHGMCGYHAAKAALKDIFNLKVTPLV